MREARHEPAPYRVRDRSEHYRNCAAFALQGCHSHRAEGKDRVRLHGQQLTREGPISFGIARSPAFLDLQTAVTCPTQLVEPLAKSGNPCLRFRVARNSD